MHDRSYTHKIGHSCIILGCLCIVIGLILIVIGVTSDIKNTTFVGIGVLSLGVGLFLSTLGCFYGKLNICYNNWAYRSRVLPANLETPRPVPIGDVQISPFAPSPPAAQKQQSAVPLDTQSPITLISEADIHKLVIAPSINIGIMNTPNNVT
jgi:hypothetical protein